jgi:uncharacterized protein YndB with AHSA1/START domain
MLIKVLLGLAAVVAVFIVLVVMQPSDFRVARSTTIAAPPSAVFAQVNDFHKWEAWNPWAKIDPAMRQTYEGPASGPGAVYKWSGNSEVGQGKMTLVESRPNERIRIRLEFLKPMAAVNTAEFMFEPKGDRTSITWSMTGRNNFPAKAIGLIMNMDKMIGGNFEKGLNDIKSIVENSVP